jgi:hypothetical protein
MEFQLQQILAVDILSSVGLAFSGRFGEEFRTQHDVDLAEETGVEEVGLLDD